MCRSVPHTLLGLGTQPLGAPLQATLASGWDVISPEEGYLTEELQERLQSCSGAAPPGASRPACGQHVQLRRGELLHDVDKTVRHFYFLIEVCCPFAPSFLGGSLLGISGLNADGREQCMSSVKSATWLEIVLM